MLNIDFSKLKLELSKKQAKIALIIFVALVVLASSIVFLAEPFFKNDKIFPNIVVLDVNIGTLTKEQAIEKLKNRLDINYLANKKIEIKLDDLSDNIKTEEMKANYDYEKTAIYALEITKKYPPIKKYAYSIISHFKKTNVYPIIKADSIIIDNKIDKLVKQKPNAMVETNVDVNDNDVVITPGKNGFIADFNKARDEIFVRISKNDYNGYVTIKTVEATPKEISYEFVYDKVHSPSCDASFSIKDNKIEVTDSVVGRDIDKEKTTNTLKLLKFGGEKITLPILDVEPKITTKTLKALLLRDTFITFSTKYNASNVGRSSNLALAAKKINGKIIASGEIFSYNDVVGSRTYENGFVDAPVYENSKLVNGIGGGVCQVSTTLYNAVLYSDLKVVKRINHSLPVAYVPLGQDATVVDGSIDFKFENSTKYPIEIIAGVNNGTLTVGIKGTNETPTKKVVITNETASTIDPTEKEIPDATIAVGERAVQTEGKAGYVVNTYKKVTIDGNFVSEEQISKSRYNMVQREVRVGTMLQ